MWTPTVNARQSTEIEELKAQIQALQERVEQLEAQPEEPRPSSIPSVSTIPDARKPQNVQEADEATALPLTLGDFPGSYKVPGSDISVKLGGYVKLDFIKDLDFIR
ncbi:MAG: hypothetical protein OET79_03055, partial [Nitrospirota bacterium]|nr:hypothetical protein [Nitrospirota bacterium]